MSIEACTLIAGGEGSVVTARFCTRQVTNDANAVDDLFGEEGQDWILVSRKDRIRDNLSNETITNL